MRLILKRTWRNDESTIGLLYIYPDNDLDNSIFRCFTLEDVERADKIKHETAIPAGEYEIAFTWSPKFKRNVLMLLNVPNFDKIYLHEGTNKEHTSGCILTAMIRRDKTIENSKPCIQCIEKLCKEAESKGEKITIKIS
jgi:hypothetical protein